MLVADSAATPSIGVGIAEGGEAAPDAAASGAGRGGVSPGDGWGKGDAEPMRAANENGSRTIRDPSRI